MPSSTLVGVRTLGPALLVAFLLALGAPVQAQKQATSVNEMVRAIEGAAVQVSIAAPMLRNGDIAAALRDATLRGVRVIALVPAAGLVDPKSYWGTLVFAGAEVYSVPSQTFRGYNLVVDDRVVFFGPLVGLPPAPSLPPTYVSREPSEIHRRGGVIHYMLQQPYTRRIDKTKMISLLKGN